MNTAIRDLLNADAYPHDVEYIQCIETHISWVLLTGEYAYKVKKPVLLPFLDFSTAERRRHFCHEELRLNQRLAPQLYLEVVQIHTIKGRLSFRQGGTVVDHAVKMRQFRSQEQLDKMLENKQLDHSLMHACAEYIANYYDKAVTRADYGEPQQVIDPVLENFSDLQQQGVSVNELQDLKCWSEHQSATLRSEFRRRKDQGCVRQLHGDLHLSNMVCINGQILAFDCLEFDPELIHIDIISEISFLFMDLLSRDQVDLAYHFLNCFVEISGDYAGVALLSYYTVYRALVRAKVNLLLAHQETGQKAELARHKYHQHMNLATSLIQPAHPAIIIMCGMAGSGKSTVSSQLMSRLPAIRLRSDLERKRLHQLAHDADTGSGINKGIYTLSSTETLYRHLQTVATQLINNNFTVLVDAAFLQTAQRQQFRQLALDLDVPFLILSCQVDADTLRDRVLQRSLRHDDPSEADINVLEYQLRHASPPEQALGSNELLSIDTAIPQDIGTLASSVKQLLNLQRKLSLQGKTNPK